MCSLHWLVDHIKGGAILCLLHICEPLHHIHNLVELCGHTTEHSHAILQDQVAKVRVMVNEQLSSGDILQGGQSPTP